MDIELIMAIIRRDRLERVEEGHEDHGAERINVTNVNSSDGTCGLGVNPMFNDCRGDVLCADDFF